MRRFLQVMGWATFGWLGCLVASLILLAVVEQLPKY